jgi:hypothetical protein
MLVNLAFGVVAMAISVVVHTLGLIVVTHAMTRVTSRLRIHGRRNRVIAMVTIATGTFGVLFLQVAIWAAFYRVLGATDDMETALYFSAVTFSTLGYGDLVPHHEWRLFSALEGVVGLLMIGWSTAYLTAAGLRVGPFRAGEHF